MEKFDEFKTLSDEYQSLYKELISKAKPAFEEGSKKIFKKYPSLKSFSWNQYAPSFNDGDPCYFRAHTDVLRMLSVDDDEGGDRIYDDEGGDRVYDDEEAAERGFKGAYADIQAFLEPFSQDILKEVFGEFATVTVDRKGVKTEFYEGGY